jgi:hypothetical protein
LKFEFDASYNRDSLYCEIFNYSTLKFLVTLPDRDDTSFLKVQYSIIFYRVNITYILLFINQKIELEQPLLCGLESLEYHRYI